jgi:putative (di)nucleoside polyphosphate hydrolase
MDEKRELIGIVIFDGEKFLLLHRILNWNGWEFPKGGVKKGETHLEAIKRELFEETGISGYEIISKIDDFGYFDFVKKHNSHATNYLVRAPNTSKITFSNQEKSVGGEKINEHDSYKWFFPNEVVKNIYHDNQKETMKKAIALLGIGE